MSTTKTYILKKDLPNAKMGAKYHITDDGKNYVCYEAMNSWDVSYPKDYIENNYEWFEPFVPFDNLIEFTKTLSPHQALLFGKVLLDESIDKKYNEEDMRKCFEAARESCKYGMKQISEGGGKKEYSWKQFSSREYETFKDYIKTIK